MNCSSSIIHLRKSLMNDLNCSMEMEESELFEQHDEMKHVLECFQLSEALHLVVVVVVMND